MSEGSKRYPILQDLNQKIWNARPLGRRVSYRPHAWSTRGGVALPAEGSPSCGGSTRIGR